MKEDKKARVKRACEILEQAYGTPARDTQGDDLTSMLVRTILSQNTNDANRDRAFEALRAAFPTWEAVCDAPPRKIAAAIRTGGLAERKSAAIRGFLRALRRERGDTRLDFLGEMTDEQVYGFLCGHKGIGVKTASIILCFGCGRDVFPVDTHIYRVSRRLGLIPSNLSREQAHEALEALIPPGWYYPLHLNFITHGRRVCHARNPRCERCILRDLCDFYAQQVDSHRDPPREGEEER